jgi:hypothetical protein
VDKISAMLRLDVAGSVANSKATSPASHPNPPLSYTERGRSAAPRAPPASPASPRLASPRPSLPASEQALLRRVPRAQAPSADFTFICKLCKTDYRGVSDSLSYFPRATRAPPLGAPAATRSTARCHTATARAAHALLPRRALAPQNQLRASLMPRSDSGLLHRTRLRRPGMQRMRDGWWLGEGEAEGGTRRRSERWATAGTLMKPRVRPPPPPPPNNTPFPHESSDVRLGGPRLNGDSPMRFSHGIPMMKTRGHELLA